jgi:branched-chain amino acid transport system permease protein
MQTMRPQKLPAPKRTGQKLALGLAILGLATLPWWIGGPYYISIASQILLYAVFALGINVLAGYGGLISLGHAGLFGLAAYACAIALQAGWSQTAAIVAALAVTLFGSAVFAVLSLRATGIGFVMITLAVGQVLWGLAYRWISLTNGDNGVNVATRPAPFGLSLDNTVPFYFATLIVFLIVLLALAIFVDSPFGASLKGTRDQARRMEALGYHVWLIRFYACLFSGLLSGIAGLLFLYYNEFISPQAVTLTASAEGLLMVIAGGAGTLLGPIVGSALLVIMKNVASAYIERWNFVLGAIYVAIVILMPEGLVPGTVRLSRKAWRALPLRPLRTMPQRAPAPAPVQGGEKRS